MKRELEDLEAVVAYIDEIRVGLDPESRYVSELVELVEKSSNLADLEQRMVESSRGLRHSGEEVFASMSLAEKIFANLITPETSLFRFSEGELEAIGHRMLPHLDDRKAKIMVVPCSHGEEAFTIAAHFLKLGVDFEVDAYDIQPTLIAEAKTGRLTFGFPPRYLDSPGFVSSEVLERIRFEVKDAFDLPPVDAGTELDVVLCRNFVGYFVPERASALVQGLAARVRPGGVLLLDTFCIQKMPALVIQLTALGFTQIGARPAFAREIEPESRH